MTDEPQVAPFGTPQPATTGMCLPTPAVEATVGNLLGFYGADSRACGLKVERYPAEGANGLYSTNLLLLEDWRLVADLPNGVVWQYLAGQMLDQAGRLHKLVHDRDLRFEEIATPMPQLPVAKVISDGEWHWRDDRIGQTHRNLSDLRADLRLHVWDPTIARFVPAMVREYQSPGWAPGQTGQGAVLVPLPGLKRRCETAVETARQRVLRQLADLVDEGRRG